MADKLNYRKATPVSLKDHSDFNEKWLQARIADDPAILGLGELEVRSLEVSHPKAGRLDLLLRDPESDRRYVVEIQLGATDASHIIRTLEYWDIQSKRYPHLDHCAVLVAEDITSRFLNVIGLFNSAVPIIAIQLNALAVDGSIVLNAVTVLDEIVRADDEEEDDQKWGQGADRAFWEQKAGAATLPAVDACFAILREFRPNLTLRYNRQYIGEYEDGMAEHIVKFWPRKQWVRAGIRIADKEVWRQRLAETPIEVLDVKSRRLVIQFTKDVFERNRELFLELLKAACEESGDED
ncbi:MAG: hypothetical protein IT366_17855 [Candidatus Hydrogenedentes bacterium]|nr:hypothetical protein [Candidatus Hydrogenedentota bacterium]